MTNLVKNRPDLDISKLEKTRLAMNGAVLDAVVTGYEGLIDGLKLPDPDDRHVLAAAIVCKASCIVTFNKKDFPDDTLEPYGLHAVHPDDFLLDVESIEPASFARAVGADFGHYVNPKLPFEDYVGSLRMTGVPKTAEKVGRLAVLFTAMP